LSIRGKSAIVGAAESELCEKGEGGTFVEGGRIAPGGELAVNTNGGGLSYNHPGMYGLLLLIEAVRQLRGECAERQVGDAEIALAHGAARPGGS
jgi:acetyl-CoA acetyltransferase